jgi:CheY-like chemotaxis protein
MDLKALRQQKTAVRIWWCPDIQMPGMNGFELLREIRAFGPDAGGSVPVVAMTAFVTYADRARILNAGFQACLPKPCTLDKLAEAILTVLNN